mmetsp:Transcript_24494/g.77064  ORF Transcript_24494/g.77064 Transcript_24494/m.77064 type:complete len:293 (-) Transcript_24494:642-1520(-)
MHFRAAMVRRYRVSLRSSWPSLRRMHSRTSASCPRTRSSSREVSSRCSQVRPRSWPWSLNILERASQSLESRSTASRDRERSLSITGRFSLAIFAFLSASSLFSRRRLASSYFQPWTSLSSLCTRVMYCLLTWSRLALSAVSRSTSTSKPVCRRSRLLESSRSSRAQRSNHRETSPWSSAAAVLLPEGSWSGTCTRRPPRRLRRPLSRECISRSTASRRYCMALTSAEPAPAPPSPPPRSPLGLAAAQEKGPASVAAGRASAGERRYLHGRLSVLETMCTTRSAICTVGPSA